MSNYASPTIHPETRKIEMASWLDDYYGKHRYGIKFPDGKVYKAEEVLAATDWRHVPGTKAHGEAWYHAEFGSVAQRADGKWEAYGRRKIKLFATPEESMEWLELNYGTV